MVNYTVAFVGASMADPELNLMLNYLNSTFQPDTSPMHYAALTMEEITEVEQQRWFKNFKINIIPVSLGTSMPSSPSSVRR